MRIDRAEEVKKVVTCSVTICDSCGVENVRELIGTSDWTPEGWLVVGHYGSSPVRGGPPCGDYCSLECLRTAVTAGVTVG